MPGKVLDAAGHAVEVLQGLQVAEIGGDLLARAGRAREVHALQLFGQIGVGELVRRAVQGGEEAEAADEDDEAEAAEADGAAAGAEDEGGDLVEGVVGVIFLDGGKEAFPETGMGEAAEVAGDGVGLAVFGGQGAPWVGGAGEVEYGVHAGAEVADLTAGGGAGEDEGEEGVKLEGGEGHRRWIAQESKIGNKSFCGTRQISATSCRSAISLSAPTRQSQRVTSAPLKPQEAPNRDA